MTTTLSWRLAMRLHRAWLAAALSPMSSLDELDQRIRKDVHAIQRLRNLIKFANQKHWQVALDSLNHSFRERLSDFGSHLLEASQRIKVPKSAPVALKDWFQDIRQLEEEFESVYVVWNDNVLVAVTESITLDDIDLGPFAIELHWDRLARPSCDCFDVVALEPNPPVNNEAVTHPHVRERSLCAGDAALPISLALNEGRLTDAFLLVRSVLRNYNPSSPYVDLEHWFGGSCQDCGGRCHTDELYFCEGCDSDICEDCFCRCGSCERPQCRSCLRPCEVCDRHFCSRCLTDSGPDLRTCCSDCQSACAHCEQLFPTDELNDDNRFCPDCEREQSPESPLPLPPDPTLGDHRHDDPDAPTANTDLCAASLAEAPVLLSPR